jgi:hypothetical protein
MKSLCKLSLFLLSVPFLTGCATEEPVVSASYASSSDDSAARAGGKTIAQAKVMAGRLKPGMTEEEVRAIFGEPDDKGDRMFPAAPKPESPELHWFYRWNVYIGYRLDLKFEQRGGQWVLTKGDWWDG